MSEVDKWFEDFCFWLRSVWSGGMQGLQDIFVAGGQYITPVIKGLFDVTVSILPKGPSSNGKSKELKSSSQKSTSVGLPGGGGFNRNVVRLAGLSGALAVGLGAYGAHVVMANPDVPDEQKISFRTANLYHFIGTGGLIAASLGKYPKVSALLMTTGSVLFCGSCYYHGLTGSPKVKQFAPYGGVTLIVAWLSLIL
ncbi:unnamed protein product [Orchesella dallaii]|uniref:Transmembrane protein n=1 Tax=Orchesella dallaii TaxID=48710 RepID=A0ABP1R6C1_9HEXA